MMKKSRGNSKTSQGTSILFFLICLTSSFGFCINSSLAQMISGRVVDSETGIGISYVNIGILGKAVGTVSNELGDFLLKHHEFITTDTLRLSILGYETLVYSGEKLNEVVAEKSLIFRMHPQPEVLQEITVMPKIFKSKIIGNNTQSKSITLKLDNNQLGSELGSVIRNNKKDALIENVCFNIASSTYDSLFFRINIYSFKNGHLSELLNKESIYAIIAYPKSGSICIDTKEYNIHINGSLFVSLEWLKDLGKGDLLFSAGILKGRSYARMTSQASWEMIPKVELGLYCKISYQ